MEGNSKQAVCEQRVLVKQLEANVQAITRLKGLASRGKEIFKAPLAPNSGAHGLFDDMPLRDNDTSGVIWDKEFQHAFDSQNLLHQLSQGTEDQMYCKGDAHEVFDVLPHSTVIWDEELEQSDEVMTDLMQCKQVIFTAPVLSKSDVNNGVFDELSSNVVWDDELPQGRESQDSLWELVVHGEYPVGMDNKQMVEPVSCKTSVETKDVLGELFDENPVWDDDPQYDTKPPNDMSLDVDYVVEPLTKDFLVLPNVEGSANKMENLTEEIILVLRNDVLWDNKVVGLSLFQEFDTKVTYITSIPYAFSFGDIFPLSNTDNVQVVSLIMATKDEKRDKVMDSLDLLFDRMTKISSTQQQLQTMMDINSQAEAVQQTLCVERIAIIGLQTLGFSQIGLQILVSPK